MKKLTAMVLSAAILFSFFILPSYAQVDLSGFTLATTEEEIAAAKKAKGNLTSILNGKVLINYYREYYAKVTLPQNLEREDVKAYKAELDKIEALLATRTLYLADYYAVESYSNPNCLENLWYVFRQNITISKGLTAMCDSYMAQNGAPNNGGIGYEFDSYVALVEARENIDAISATCNDAEGLLAYNRLCAAVDNLKKLDNSVEQTQTPADLSAKMEMYKLIPSFEWQLSRDTKTEKSPETIEFARLIQTMKDLLYSYTATARDFNNAYYAAEDYRINVFMPAINVGRSFVLKARELYYSVSDNKDLYSVDSWVRVNSAMNACDGIYATGTDVQCAESYKCLVEAIENLVLNQDEVLAIKLSSAEASRGQSITISVSPEIVHSNIIYGNFNLYFDSTVLEYVSSSVPATLCDGSVFIRLDCAPHITTDAFFTVTFKIKDDAAKSTTPLLLSVDRLRDKSTQLLKASTESGSVTVTDGYPIGNISKTGNDAGISDCLKLFMYNAGKTELDKEQLAIADIDNSGDVSISDAVLLFMRIAGKAETLSYSFNDGIEETSVKGARYALAEMPTSPTKEGFVFRGWYTGKNGTGEKLEESVFLTSSKTVYAYFEEFLPGPLPQNRIDIGGWCAIYTSIAVEDDFKMLAENGISFIILDFHHDNLGQSLKCVEWAEKYGIKLLINDSLLNNDSALTVAKVLEYTQPYRSSPAFAGNDLVDEPSSGSFGSINAKTSVYMQALPGYDMHVNLLGHYASYEMLGEMNFENYIGAFAKTVDTNHICADTYPFGEAGAAKKTYDYYYEAFAAMAQAAKENNLEHWEYLQTIAYMDQSSRVPSIADLRFEVYTALAYGAAKMMHFTYDVPHYTPGGGVGVVYAMRDYAHNYTEIWDWAQLVNNEANAFANVYAEYNYAKTGTYKTANAPAYAAKVTSYDGTELQALSSNQSLLIGSFNAKSGNGKAVLIANAADLALDESATVSFAASGNLTIYINGQQQLLQAENGIYTISLKAGQGAFITIN